MPSDDEMKPVAQTSRNSGGESCINSISKQSESSVKKFDIFHSMNSSSASKSNLIRNQFLAKFEMSTTSQKYSEHSRKKSNDLRYKIEPPKNSSAPKVQNNFTCAKNDFPENFDNKSEGQIAKKTGTYGKEMAVKKVKIYKYQNLYQL